MIDFENSLRRYTNDELNYLISLSDYEMTEMIRNSIKKEIVRRFNAETEHLKYDNKRFVIFFGDLKNFTGVNFSLKRCYYDKYLDEYVINVIDISWNTESYNYYKCDKTWSFELLNKHLSHDFITIKEVDGDTFDDLWKKYSNENVPISTFKDRIINDIKMFLN